jgi:hypothetical protein
MIPVLVMPSWGHWIIHEEGEPIGYQWPGEWDNAKYARPGLQTTNEKNRL